MPTHTSLSPVSAAMLAAAVTQALAFAPHACIAQGSGAAATHPGSLSSAADAQLGTALHSGAQRTLAFAGADKILAIARRDEALAHPVGYAASLRRVAGITTSSEEGTPMAGEAPQFGVRGSIRYFGLEDNGRGGREITPSGGGFSFSIVANGLGRFTDMERITIPLDHGPPVLSAYRRAGEFRGHPIYEGDNEECAYVPTGRNLRSFR